MTLDMMQTLAAAGVALLLGEGLRKWLPVLARLNLPGPVLGGFCLSAALWAWTSRGGTPPKFDVALKDPLVIAFFASIGFGASFRILATAGKATMVFLLLCCMAAVLQNVVGAVAAKAMGLPPLFGVLCGSVALTGGPVTAAGFAPAFKDAGVESAIEVGVAAAMGGIVIGGLMGGPLGTFLIGRLRKRGEFQRGRQAGGVGDGDEPETGVTTAELVRGTIFLLLAMWAGSALLDGFGRATVAWQSYRGVENPKPWAIPVYLGAMLAAAALRNFDDATDLVKLPMKAVETLGDLALTFFLAVALITLDLGKLAGMAGPILVLLGLQALLVVVFCLWPLFPACGRDYDAAVTAGGFTGFMMGTTANAMANMDALAKRFGPAPRAFLVVPIVGALFIDFFNALLVQGCLAALGPAPVAK